MPEMEVRLTQREIKKIARCIFEGKYPAEVTEYQCASLIDRLAVERRVAILRQNTKIDLADINSSGIGSGGATAQLAVLIKAT